MSKSDQNISRAEYIIMDVFGGVRPMARKLPSVNSHLTVYSWKKRRQIPAHWHQEILDTARALKLPLEPSDFFEPA